MDVKNTSKAPQGIHTLDGIVYVLPGETKSVRLNETLHGHAKALDFFKLKGELEKDDLGKADEPVAKTADTDALNAEIKGLKEKLAERDAEIEKLKSAKQEEPAKTPAEVLAMATNPEVQFMTFKAAAAKLLGDKTPSKKDEIVAALEELATQP
ncbi:hypothetical protein [Agrobacterium tumefaciens]|uniref:Uncharacterized protein n=1 Tax=Agrobacterium tumefaciens TaxID=358 RepID=A0A2L2LBW0_AGRTU|nr:hypothetical protein [Agrobacterium tumefaciens]AVH41823.1 hypothetical protein At1D1609_17690 [Agrobacterium tumefaciens]NSY95744.1 hypothetical protein [Agrobacterium tumefaciens]